MARDLSGLKRGDIVRVKSQFREVPQGALGKVSFIHEVCYDYHKVHYGYEAHVEIEGRTYQIEIEYLEKADAIERLGRIET